MGHLPLVNVTAYNAVTYNHQLPLEWQPPQMLSLQFVAPLHFAFVKTWHKRAGPFRLLTLEGNIQLLQQFYWEQHLFLFLCVIDIKLMHYLLLKLWHIPWKQWSFGSRKNSGNRSFCNFSNNLNSFFFQLFCTQDMRVQKMMEKLKSTNFARFYVLQSQFSYYEYKA